MEIQCLAGIRRTWSSPTNLGNSQSQTTYNPGSTSLASRVRNRCTACLPYFLTGNTWVASISKIQREYLEWHDHINCFDIDSWLRCLYPPVFPLVAVLQINLLFLFATFKKFSWYIKRVLIRKIGGVGARKISNFSLFKLLASLRCISQPTPFPSLFTS